MRKKEDIFENSCIEINKNIMKYGDEVIQLSSVARVKVGPIPKIPYPPICIMGAVIGITIFLFLESYRVYGLVIGAACLFYIWWIATRNDLLGDFLAIELNSGKAVFFSSDKDNAFLNEAQNAMVECFNKESQYKVINFKHCTIKDTIISGGDMRVDNSMRMTNSNNGNVSIGGSNRGDIISDTSSNKVVIDGSNNKVDRSQDFEKLSNILADLMNCVYDIDSTEYDYCEKAVGLCQEEDSKGLCRFIEKHRDVFSGIASSISSTAIIEIVKRLTGIVL